MRPDAQHVSNGRISSTLKSQITFRPMFQIRKQEFHSDADKTIWRNFALLVEAKNKGRP